MILALVLLGGVAAVALAALLRTRSDIRRLSARIAESTAESNASLAVDFFGQLDTLAALVYRMRSDLERRLTAAEWQKTVLQHILSGMGEGVLAIDHQRRIVLANRRFAEIFAVEGGLVGRPFGETVRNATVFAGLDRALAHQDSAERFSIRSGLEERTIEMRAFSLPSRDIAAVALFIDVTRLEQLEQIRREFIADFSHEVRTPLAALRSAVDTFDVSGGRMTAEEEQQLRRIMSRQLRRLERLVADLSELSQIEAGDLGLERTEIDLRRLVDDLCEDFAERAAQNELRLVVSGDGTRVSADPMRVQQALANLIDNAIKYGGRAGTIDIEVADRRDAAVVRITDHGEGIPPSERDSIFRRLYRVDKSRSETGSGLGLAITKHLILLHGGAIDVESEPGKGATFVVMLPK